jgi:hypothetical protein
MRRHHCFNADEVATSFLQLFFGDNLLAARRELHGEMPLQFYLNLTNRHYSLPPARTQLSTLSIGSLSSTKVLRLSCMVSFVR